jgi:RNA polymerase sigma-70 factor (ECF subfamily)
LSESRKPKDKPSTDADKVSDADPSAVLLADERTKQVQAAIKELPENDRIILVMSEYNELAYEEISEILGLPIGTVKSRMFYALQHLREKLKGKLQ